VNNQSNPFAMQPLGLACFLFLLGSPCCAQSPSASAPAGEALNARIEALYQNIASKVDDVPTISASSLLSQKAIPTPIFVDVRESRERSVSHIPGAITLDQLAAAYRAKPRPIIVYCTIGYRSGLTTRKLRAKGMPANNLRGGILSWIAHGGRLLDGNQKQTYRVHVYAKEWAVVPKHYSAVY
jgi:rhodanese-related sulfurtransferase